VAHFNPLTYAVTFFRTIVLEKGNLPVERLVEDGLAFEFGSFTATKYCKIGH
jgi:hypothetical protein